MIESTIKFRATEEEIKAIDDYRRKCEDLPSREQALRRIMEQALYELGYEIDGE